MLMEQHLILATQRDCRSQRHTTPIARAKDSQQTQHTTSGKQSLTTTFQCRKRKMHSIIECSQLLAKQKITQNSNLIQSRCRCSQTPRQQKSHRFVVRKLNQALLKRETQLRRSSLRGLKEAAVAPVNEELSSRLLTQVVRKQRSLKTSQDRLSIKSAANSPLLARTTPTFKTNFQKLSGRQCLIQVSVRKPKSSATRSDLKRSRWLQVLSTFDLCVIAWRKQSCVILISVRTTGFCRTCSGLKLHKILSSATRCPQILN